MHSVEQIVEDPNWFLQGINLDSRRLNFVKTSRAALCEASFLDQRFDTKGLPSTSFGLNELLDYINREDAPIPAPPRFIFHTAFCCSTLLGRCLDLPGSNLSLKEPEVLMTLANYRRVGHELLSKANDAKEVYRLVMLLLFRPFSDNETVVVKPTNTVNNIISPLLATHTQSRAVLLHSDLQSFLISILKKGERGRGFARHLFNIFLMDSPEAQQLQSKQLIGMTDLQIAAIVWHLQLEHFFDALAKFDSSIVKSLHCDRLLADSEVILAELVAHLAMPQLELNFQAMLANAPLQQNAKMPDQAFSANDRSKQYQIIESQFSESLAMIGNWAKQLRFKHAYSENIGNRL
ncbi:MAG: hypothetical protein ACI8XV_002359 [Arenicella sp.]|jgi:hypothetical protein